MPLITLYTPTFPRPRGLAACLASVQAQTWVRDIEHLVVVDHYGKGIGGMYQEIVRYRDAVHGEYVYVLSDDDVLASPGAVERLAGATVIASVTDPDGYKIELIQQQA